MEQYFEGDMPVFPQYVASDITNRITAMLYRVGIYSRVFSRIKSKASICKKLNAKQYITHNKLMQDLIGIRITVYFDDDVSIVMKMLRKTFDFDSETVDTVTTDVFRPTRTNMIFRIPDDILSSNQFHKAINDLPIDNTFEVQIRTVLSEGWHEVEHDLRYKQKKAWEGHDDYGRALNSILATLVSCDWSMRILFENLSHTYYMDGQWIAMCQNHLRIHLLDNEDDIQAIQDLLNQNHSLCKYLLKVDREKLLLLYFEFFEGFPCTLKNIVYVCSYFVEDCKVSIPKLISEQIAVHKEELQKSLNLNIE